MALCLCGQHLVPALLVASFELWVELDQEVVRRLSSTVLSLSFPCGDFFGTWDLKSDQMSVPSPLQGPQLDWCVWISSLLGLSHTGMVLIPGWGLLIPYQACGTALDGLQLWMYWRGQICWRICGDREGAHSFSKVCHICYRNLGLRPGWRRRVHRRTRGWDRLLASCIGSVGMRHDADSAKCLCI